MRTVVINGSPRKMGNTAAMLKEMAKFADEEGSRTDYLDLVDLRIADCKACMKCREQGECAQKDDLAMLSTVIKEADLLMLGSPVYMGAETGLMKCFTERLFSLAAGASPTNWRADRPAKGRPSRFSPARWPTGTGSIPT